MAQEVVTPLERAATPEAEQESERRKERSKIAFPYGDLNQAIEVVKAINDNAGIQCTADQLAAYLHHGTVYSSAFRTKVTTARIFDLIRIDRDQIALTALGRRILDPQHERAARAQAFLRVPLYKAIFEQYRGQSLPPDIGLEGAMVSLGVATKQKDKARQAFQRSADQAGLFSSGRNRLVLPPDVSLADTPGEVAKPSPTGRPTESRPSITPHTAPPPKFGGGGNDGGGGGSDTSPASNKLIQGLFEDLPPLNRSWSQDELSDWIALANLILRRVYKMTIPDTVVQSSHERGRWHEWGPEETEPSAS